LLDQVQSDFTRSERDNDLIYHQDVPSPSALPPIVGASVISSTVPPGLDDPQKQLVNEDMVFGSMISLGARQAIGSFASFFPRIFVDQDYYFFRYL
jgi:programmed cell death 6-interacting protein